MFGHACVRVCSGGRVAAIPVPVQLHANARTTEPTLRRQGLQRLQRFAGHNDVVPHELKRE